MCATVMATAATTPLLATKGGKGHLGRQASAVDGGSDDHGRGRSNEHLGTCEAEKSKDEVQGDIESVPVEPARPRRAD